MKTETKPSTSANPYQQVADSLRRRIAAGEWRPGEMIPGRRALAAEYGVAAATLERAAGALIADGILDASGRGTFVAGRSTIPDATVAGTGGSALRLDALQATVGIIAPVIPFEEPEMRAGQWVAQILAECEHLLAGQPGVTQRFFPLIPALGADVPPLEAAQQLIADGVDGLVLVTQHDDLAEILALTERAGIPLVYAGFDPVMPSVPQVYIDNLAGGALAARHLRDRGYRNLTYLRPFSSIWSETRLAGAQSILGPGHLRVFPAERPQVGPRETNAREIMASGLAAARSLLSTDFVVGTGVIVPNDAVALEFIQIAMEKGLVAGRDYGLVGFDDYQRDLHLTSLRPPLAQVGREAASLLLRLLRREDAPSSIALQHRLIARSSTLLPNDAGADAAFRAIFRAQ